jgi:TonB family protein
VEDKPRVEKKEEPKKIEPPKKEIKPKTEPDKKLVTKAQFEKDTHATKPSPKTDTNYLANAIRARFAKNFVKVESTGPGPGPANGVSGSSGNDLAAYCSMLSSRLYEVWEIPGQATSTMSTVVVIRVASDGSLSYLRIMKPSGSATMDESAVAAVNRLKKADPLPASLGRVRDLTVTFQPLGA